MRIGQVKASVWATRKAQNLAGQTFLVVDTDDGDIVAAGVSPALVVSLVVVWLVVSLVVSLTVSLVVFSSFLSPPHATIIVTANVMMAHNAKYLILRIKKSPFRQLFQSIVYPKRETLFIIQLHQTYHTFRLAFLLGI